MKPSFKRGTHLGFNAIRELKKNVLTFCLHKVLIKRRVSTLKSFIWFSIDSSVQQMEYYEKKVSTLRHFEMFSIYFEHNRNSIES